MTNFIMSWFVWVVLSILLYLISIILFWWVKKRIRSDQSDIRKTLIKIPPFALVAATMFLMAASFLSPFFYEYPEDGSTLVSYDKKGGATVHPYGAWQDLPWLDDRLTKIPTTFDMTSHIVPTEKGQLRFGVRLQVSDFTSFGVSQAECLSSYSSTDSLDQAGERCTRAKIQSWSYRFANDNREELNHLYDPTSSGQQQKLSFLIKGSLKKTPELSGLAVMSTQFRLE